MIGVNRGPRSDDPTGSRLGAVRRTLEQQLPTRESAAVTLGAPWVSGVLGAVQALVFSLAVVVVPAIAMAVAANAQLSAATSGWTAAVPVASRLWLLGHGVPLPTGGATVTLVPLGITAAAVFAVFVSARRTIVPTRSAFWSATLTYVCGVLLVALATGSTSGLQTACAALGGVAVALVGLAGGLLTGPEPGPFTTQTRALVARVPTLLRTGTRGAATSVAALAILSGLLTLVWVLIGWSTIGDVLSDLRLDTASSVSLGIAQLALLPNLAVYAATWLAGPGFSVGAGTHFGPDLVTSGPLPAIPLLGALPTPTTGGGVALWAPVLVVLAGVCGGWAVSRRTDRLVWWHTVVLAGIVGTWAGLVTAAMVGLASGVAGPGRLADVGASSVYLGGCVALQTGAGALLALLATRAEVHTAVATASRAVWARVRGRADGARAAGGGGAGVAEAGPEDRGAVASVGTVEPTGGASLAEATAEDVPSKDVPSKAGGAKGAPTGGASPGGASAVKTPGGTPPAESGR